jgi:hypothetical protein
MAIVLDGTNGVTTNSGTLISATTIGVGGATPSASGSGITFPATQSASTDANTLDDYEEGNWTPTWLNIGTGTYTTQFGRYTKVGRLVTIECYLVINAIGSASGNAEIAGLPFTCSNTVATAQIWANNFVSSGQNVCGLGSSGTQLALFSIPASSGVTQLTMSALTNNSNVVFNYSYSVG